jgi:hypothetical protein
MSVHARVSRIARSRGILLVTAPLLACAAVAIPAGPAAQAAVAAVTCTGTSPITYTPGLTFTARTLTYTETDNFSSCTSSDPALTSGTSTSTTTGPFSCLSPLTIDEDPGYTVTWNNGQSSTFDLTYTDTIAAGIENVTGTGTVTSGEFTGATGTFVWVYTVPIPLLCLTTGVTSQSGTLAAAILSA